MARPCYREIRCSRAEKPCLHHSASERCGLRPSPASLVRLKRTGLKSGGLVRGGWTPRIGRMTIAPRRTLNQYLNLFGDALRHERTTPAPKLNGSTSRIRRKPSSIRPASTARHGDAEQLKRFPHDDRPIAGRKKCSTGEHFAEADAIF